ncbi:MAG: radical SAM family heme chaperone HemW [Rhodothermales bacterium]|nr:radical SAM family heme chaperone HemW [Rhodothermales bacterium]
MAGIYIHVPFCTQRCVYCDFYFVTTATTYSPYVDALVNEIDHYGAKHISEEPIRTVYFGGGTPSLLKVADVQRILLAIENSFQLELEELTFEMNPEDGSHDYLSGLRDAGIDRLSIGVQSFYDRDLEFMNRSHNAEQAESVVETVRAAGFDNFSIDLIFGIPGQPPEYWAANLEKAARLDVPHVSTYGLTIEPETPLFKMVRNGKVTAISEEDHADQFRFTIGYMVDAGYEHYEISSFAKPGHRAVHNHAYWSHTNYLGFGPSAHSFWWRGLPARRWVNVKNLRQYEGLLSGRTTPVEMEEHLDLDTLANEHIMLRLRTEDGLDMNFLESQYGLDLYEERVDDLAWLESEGFIEPIRNNRVKLTLDGKIMADMVTSKLMIG